jgi:hypothetical protein
MFRKLSLALIGGAGTLPFFMDESTAPSSARHGISILYPNNSNARGVVSFSQ